MCRDQSASSDGTVWHPTVACYPPPFFTVAPPPHMVGSLSPTDLHSEPHTPSCTRLKKCHSFCRVSFAHVRSYRRFLAVVALIVHWYWQLICRDGLGNFSPGPGVCVLECVLYLATALRRIGNCWIKNCFLAILLKTRIWLWHHYTMEQTSTDLHTFIILPVFFLILIAAHIGI